MKEYEHDQRVMSYILDDKAKTLGDKIFALHHDDKISYKEMSVVTNRISNYLINEFNVKKNDNIAVILPNCLDFVKVQFGISKSGAVMVPINVQAKLDMLAYFINQCDAEILIIDEQYFEIIEPLQKDLSKVKKLVIRRSSQSVSSDKFDKKFTLYELDDLITYHDDSPCKTELHWYDPADIFYTSGTTGVSKGIVLPYNHHYTFGRGIVDFARLGSEDRMYICLPLYHGMASYMSIMPMLISEGSIALGDRFSASRWLSEIRKYNATVTWGVYSVGPILMKQPVHDDDADNPLRVYIFSGMPPDTVGAFETRYGVKAIDSYGSTEQEDIAHAPWDERRYGAVGKINTSKYEVKIVNENDEEVPAGQEGEIVSRCKYPYTQMIEYYNMPAETVKCFRNRWLHSGDLGRIDEDGWLYFVGRGKDSIRRRGENVSCYELETIVSAHELIEESAAIPVQSDLGEDDIKVIVSVKSGNSLDFNEFLGFCREKMPKYMVPRYIEIVDSLPKLANEKVDKVKLKETGLTPNTWDYEDSDGNYVKM